jgi:hypothetical protein
MRSFRTLGLPVILIILAFTITLSAASVTIPAANTNTTSNRKPINTWFGFERTVSIYTAAEHGMAPGSTVTDVCWYVNAVTSPADSPTTILMSTTTATTLVASTYASQIAGATTVFTGNITGASLVPGSFRCVAITPFVYTGDNLKIMVQTDAGGGGTDPSSTAKQFRWSAGTTLSWAQDTTAPTGNGAVTTTRPNIQMMFNPPVGPGTLEFSSATYSGNEGTSATVTVNRVGGQDGAVSVNYATSNGTATGADYTTATGTLSWAAADSAPKTFTVPLLTDAVTDPAETVILTLSGVVGTTITGTNPATLTITDVPPPFNGAYTVGSGGNYPSLTNAGGIFEAINLAGTTGAVTVNVISDLTVELGTNALNPVGGGFPVTIQPSGGAARQIIGSNATTALIDFNGADNITIDGLNTGGNSLLIRNTGTTPTIRYINDASTNILRNSTIEGASASANVNISTGTTTGNDDIQILNNTIRDRSDAAGVPFNAVHSVGTNITGNSNTNITISNNQIFNFTQAGFLSANSENVTVTLNTIYQTDPRVSALIGVAVNSAIGTNLFSRNVIRDLTTTLATSGMVFNDARATTVSRNWIYNIPSTTGSTATLTGIIFNGASGTAASVTVANNFVSIVPAFANAQIVRGILDFGFGGNTFTGFYNSVLLDGTASGAVNSFACGRLFSAPTAFTFQDNVCFNNRTGGTGNHYAMSDQSAATGTFVSDYNMFVGTGVTAANFFDYGTASAGTPVTYAAWQTGPPARDANSIQSNPGIGSYTVALTFLSQSDLHQKLTSPAIDKGTAVSVLDDFDGSIRSVSGFVGGLPDIGGDEFLAIPTAATSSVRGRVLTPTGRGLMNAFVILTNTNTGEVRYARTTTLGYFNIQDLPTGDLYVINVNSKRYRFNSQSFTLNEDLDGLVLTGQ